MWLLIWLIIFCCVLKGIFVIVFFWYLMVCIIKFVCRLKVCLVVIVEMCFCLLCCILLCIRIIFLILLWVVLICNGLVLKINWIVLLFVLSDGVCWVICCSNFMFWCILLNLGNCNWVWVLLFSFRFSGLIISWSFVMVINCFSFFGVNVVCVGLCRVIRYIFFILLVLNSVSVLLVMLVFVSILGLSISICVIFSVIFLILIIIVFGFVRLICSLWWFGWLLYYLIKIEELKILGNVVFGIVNLWFFVLSVV